MLEVWSQAEVGSTHFLSGAGGELKGHPAGQPRGLSRNVGTRSPERPPVAFNPTAGAHPICERVGKGVEPRKPDVTCGAREALLWEKSSLYRAKKWVPAQAGSAGWD